MIFRFMEKYRVPILLVLLLGLVGFGVWTFVLSSLKEGGDGTVDWDEIYATYEVGGETHEMTREQFEVSMGRVGSADRKAAAEYALADGIRTAMLAAGKVTITEDEFEAAFKRIVRDPNEQLHDGKFNEKAFVALCNSQRMTPKQFKARMREDLRMTKMMSEIVRVQNVHSIDDIYGFYRKVFKTYRLKAVFFDTAEFVEAAKLELDDDGKPTAAAQKLITKYWTDLDEAKRKTYNRNGAELTTNFIGFRFHGVGRDKDEELTAEFERVSKFSKTSLMELTKDFEPSDADLAKLKLRLDRTKSAYGVEPKEDQEFDLDAAFETKKSRLIIEWKILSLMKKLHVQILADVIAKKDVDFGAIAKANNLSSRKFSKVKLQNLQKDEDFPGRYPLQLQNLADNAVLTVGALVNDKSNAFFSGPVDEIGKHASIWRLLSKNLRPLPALTEVQDLVVVDYEKSQASELRDEAVQGFDDAMDVWLEEQLKDELKPIREEATKAIAELTKDLDAEKDKEKIETITTEENDKAEAKIVAEKDKKRSDAFKIALADTKALVVEEGFFEARQARGELAVDREKASLEEKSRSALRKEFPSLNDDVFKEDEVEIGTASEWVESRTYPGLKGRAILLEKYEPTAAQMAMDPKGFELAERSYDSYIRAKGITFENIWALERIENNFEVNADKIKAYLAKIEEDKRELDQRIQERNEKRAKAKKAREAAQE